MIYTYFVKLFTIWVFFFSKAQISFTLIGKCQITLSTYKFTNFKYYTGGEDCP